jgi:hypothetical protein
MTASQRVDAAALLVDAAALLSGITRCWKRLFIPAVIAPPVPGHALAEGKICGARQTADDFVFLHAQLIPLAQAALAAARAFVFMMSHLLLYTSKR